MAVRQGSYVSSHLQYSMGFKVDTTMHSRSKPQERMRDMVPHRPPGAQSCILCKLFSPAPLPRCWGVHKFLFTELQESKILSTSLLKQARLSLRSCSPGG